MQVIRVYGLLLLAIIFTGSLLAEEQYLRDIPYYKDKGEVKGGDVDYALERGKLDIHIPQGKNFATIIFFHGGALKEGSKGIPTGFRVNANFAAVSPNYRFSGERGKCPDYLDDAAAAVAWTIRNIQKYGGDPSRIYLSGMSAGSYLAVMLTLDSQWLGKYGIFTSQISGVFAVSGQMSTHSTILYERRKRGEKGWDKEPIIDDFAPLRHISANAPPLFFYVGDPECDLPGRAEENAYMYSLMKRMVKHPTVKLCILQGRSHGTVFRPAVECIKEDLKELEKANGHGENK